MRNWSINCLEHIVIRHWLNLSHFISLPHLTSTNLSISLSLSLSLSLSRVSFSQHPHLVSVPFLAFRVSAQFLNGYRSISFPPPTARSVYSYSFACFPSVFDVFSPQRLYIFYTFPSPAFRIFPFILTFLQNSKLLQHLLSILSYPKYIQTSFFKYSSSFPLTLLSLIFSHLGFIEYFAF